MDEQEKSLQLEHALLSLDRSLVRTVLTQNIAPEKNTLPDIADNVINPALHRIGTGWETGRVTLSQVFMAGKIMEEAVEGLFPKQKGSRHSLRIGIGVLEDYHALGKRIVQTVLLSSGYNVQDLGLGVSVSKLAELAVSKKLDLLMISVLMFNKALHVKAVRQLLDEQGYEKLPIVVGGAPFHLDPELWRQVGAQFCGKSAGDALRICAEFNRGPQ